MPLCAALESQVIPILTANHTWYGQARQVWAGTTLKKTYILVVVSRRQFDEHDAWHTLAQQVRFSREQSILCKAPHRSATVHHVRDAV
jgi:hypothetical protein